MKNIFTSAVTIICLSLLLTACMGKSNDSDREESNATTSTGKKKLRTIVEGDTMEFCKLKEGNVALTRWYHGDKRKNTLNVPANVVIDGKGYTVTEIGGEALMDEETGGMRTININIPATIERITGADNFYRDGMRFGTINVESANPHFKVIDNVLFSQKGDSIYWASLNQKKPVTLQIPRTLNISAASLRKLVAEGDEPREHLENISKVVLEKGHPTLMIIDGRLYNKVDGYMLLSFNRKKEIELPNFCRGISAVLPIDFEKVTFDPDARGIDIFSCYKSMLNAYAGLPMKFVWLGAQRDIEPMDMGAIKMFSDLVLRTKPNHPEAQSLNDIVLKNMPE